MMLEIEVQEIGEDTAAIFLSGEMDIYSSPRLLEEISALVERGRPFIALDLSALSYMDTAGLATMSAGVKEVHEAGGYIRLISPPPCRDESDEILGTRTEPSGF
ncbi:STAS domain-containing protein [Nitrospinae bacterium AH_259_B05_G02_I21]|nr:STAS domain-containing protein [Nitrospinae bacterium AH_259_B05_G02_I21]